MSSSNAIAIYVRVSLEDQDLKCNDAKSESNSLTNQRELLNSYIENHDDLAGKQIFEYSDDGFTGRNFDRPGFSRMIEAVKAGDIDCIITKDCSRFGRDYIEVGEYIEHIFPFLGVRFVAVNDGYDSAKSDGLTPSLDFAFKNLIYDLYSKDLSKKVTSGIQTRMKKGQYVSAFGLYGYKKSDDRKVPLVIDEPAAAIIRNIFQLAIENNSSQTIARILNQEKVRTPSEYRRNQGTLDFWHPKGKTPLWSTATVGRIIRDERYMGNMVYYKRVKSKVKKRTTVINPEENRMRVQNTHDAIVSQDAFELANACLHKRSAVDASRKKMSVFYCPYCGHRLRESHSKTRYYYCYSARMHAQEECKKVIIDKEYIENLVLEVIRNQVKHLIELQNKSKSCVLGDSLDTAKQIEHLEKKVEILERDKITLYEQFREGEYTKEEFLDEKYRQILGIQGVKEKIDELLEKQNVDRSSSKKLDESISTMVPYMEISSYDKNIIPGIIKKVIVHGMDRVEVVWMCGDEYFWGMGI